MWYSVVPRVANRLATRLAAMSAWRWTALLATITLVVCLTWIALISPRSPRFDENDYLGLASSLTAGQGSVNAAGEPSAFWSIGYPLVLSMAYRLLGESTWVPTLLQIAIHFSTCWLIAFCGSRWFDRRIARLAALGLAVYPTHVAYTTLRLTEPIFTLLVTSACFMVMQHRTSRSALGGFLLGFAMLVRSTAALLPVPLAVWAVRNSPRDLTAPRRSVGAKLVQIGIVGLVAGLTISPWLLRNHELTGRWTVLSTNGGFNFWIGNAEGSFGGPNHSREVNTAMADPTDAVLGFAMGREAIRNAPGEAVLRAMRKVTYFFALETDGVLWNLKGKTTEPSILVQLVAIGTASTGYVVLCLLAILGLLALPSDHPVRTLFLYLLIYFVALTIVFIGDPRYHHVLVPLATLFASKGLLEDLETLGHADQRRLKRRTALVSAILFALMVSNLWIKAVELGSMG